MTILQGIMIYLTPSVVLLAWLLARYSEEEDE